MENKDNIYIEAEDANEILYKIIEQYKLDFEKIIKYVRETNSKSVLDKLLILAKYEENMLFQRWNSCI